MKTERVIHMTPVQALSRQRGASLLEGIAYLGIAAIVVLGAVSLLTGAFGSAKSNQTTEEIVALRTSVRKLYAGQPYPNSSMLVTLIPAKAVPNTLVVNTTNNTATNSWGGAVTIQGNAAGTQFTITYNSVPQDVCVSVVSGSNGWIQISDGAATIGTFPATAAQANTVCQSATSNNLTFTAT